MEDKGRVKLPPGVRAFLVGPAPQEAPDPVVFVTSTDGVTARIYPIPAWMETETFLNAQRGEAAKAAKQTLFLANAYGEDAAIDAQHRLVFPTNLRRKLNMEGRTVWFHCANGYVTVYSQEMYAARTGAAEAQGEANMELLESLGMP